MLRNKRALAPLQNLKDKLIIQNHSGRKSQLIANNIPKNFGMGFTLVELLIVVLIIGILAAIGVPQFAKAIEKARGGEAKAGLGHIQTGEKLYFAEYEVYTNDINDLDITLSERYWSFTITTPTPYTYSANAKRMSGPYLGQTIIMDQDGNITGDWENSVQ